ncbi:galactinol--sucrose galactosyltransferase-like [Hibiscus syriacus]|uniref:Galactinol--sucrose galactosyltransferase-like n=1 Tax=Hibiscus syriacus TaxID=106335 RepID=A0A6A2XKU8_HIBSY|nr:uncharacterized protein LOC120165905 [Hibiscus syriacus]KAE8676152.1 galactinol--sucrose galactosyltransferase-like [Hibiscus syriacus]
MKRKDKESDNTMADSSEVELQRSNDCSFVWDPQTRLYFHASSGFYHDPDAGWYYSSRDGLYYTFENGNYVLLDKEGAMAGDSVLNEPDATASNGPEYHSSSQGNEVDPHNTTINIADESTAADLMEYTGIQGSEHPPPPSEWLEDTLIDLYLSGYNLPVDSAADANTSLETDDNEKFTFPSDGNDEMYELEEGEWIPEENHGFADSSEVVPYEGDTWDEENWRAQYGQVTHCEEEPVPEFPVVELWDWSMVTRPKQDGKNQVARLIGRLVKPSAKVHPSVPSGGGLLKTAPICEVHLDLVRVRTGQVYRLRTPSPRYLASLSTYDSSVPTKDWGFPDLLVNKKASLQFKSRQKHKSEVTEEKGFKDFSILSDQPSTSLKGSHVYRDRAAERRTLHGGFGLGPGQKSVATEHDSDPTCLEDAKSEALNKSFGEGSYARRILEGMGWKEGEALGSTTKGLTEPLQLIGNIGNAGLGWPQTRHH